MLKQIYTLVTPWAISNKANILKNRIIGRVVNYIYPIYCKINPIQRREICKKQNEMEVIVSLTSFPDRINKVYLCINSLLRQKKRATKIILWLAESQFPNGNGVPNNLRELENKGLTIRYCEDLRSYKKIFFTAQEYPNSIIVTVDDDTLYPETWLKDLLDTYVQYPNCVCCYRAHKMVFQNGQIAPYNEWIGLSPNEKGPSKWLVPIGVGGVLYPPGYFKNVKFNFDVIKEICPTTDDLWLKVIGLKNGYKAVKVTENSKEWFTIISSQKKSLMKKNVYENVNDISLKNLIMHYNIERLLSRGDKNEDF